VGITECCRVSSSVYGGKRFHCSAPDENSRNRDFEVGPAAHRLSAAIERMSMDEDKAKVMRAQLMRKVTEDWAAELEWFALNAKINRAKYLAYLKEGFTEVQALELCKP
jgi:hypothetical protein